MRQVDFLELATDHESKTNIIDARYGYERWKISEGHTTVNYQIAETYLR